MYMSSTVIHTQRSLQEIVPKSCNHAPHAHIMHGFTIPLDNLKGHSIIAVPTRLSCDSYSVTSCCHQS